MMGRRFRFQIPSVELSRLLVPVLMQADGPESRTDLPAVLTEVRLDRTLIAGASDPAELSFEGDVVRVQSSTGFRSTIDLEAATAELEMDGNHPADAFRFHLRTLAALLALRMGGLLLHSSAIARPDGAVVFLGATGTGKSTLASFSASAGAAILSDDLNAILPAAAGYEVYGMPACALATPLATSAGAFPLRCLYHLAQAPEDRVEPLSPAERTAMLMVQSPFVNMYAQTTEALLHNAARLARMVPMGRLHFTESMRFWSLI